ncbi:unnamed protein product, partial [Polarella glacialis]
LRRQLSQQKELRDAAASVEQDTGLIRPMKPKYCMCWFMELDDSEVSRWCMETAKEVATCHSLGSSTRDWLQQIEAWLPTEPLSRVEASEAAAKSKPPR